MAQSYRVKLAEEVVDHLSKKNVNILRLDILITGGGCCDTIESTQLTYKAPKNTDLYNEFDVDGVTVYVSKMARVTAPVLSFKLVKQLFVKTIEPTGLSIKSH
ncbi:MULTISPECIES: hypothetical protein [unclassified Fusibacter]|uniref:hypothetical protein n=1 Tax=unclassified Fusibacter TaxID=2624464 RepID=UPI001011672A|nr:MULTISPECIES: hypothetical protein [unclassified Fusibacter]MCK8059361.1 hypothetical protein [Fusibacter sp. A2]NPE21175.1 hypothetical protein [Fusibacter sp. A1]RXV62443.1 hypothetical protein DWB64_05015 [Fusibacter sp. A1]